MFVTKRKHIEGLEKEYKRGLQVGTELLERRVEETEERAYRLGFNRGWTDRTNYYDISVIPELKGKIMGLEFKLKESEEGQEKAYQNGIEQGELNRNINYTNMIIEEERKQHREAIANYEVANKSLREIGERLMFRVSELKDEKEEMKYGQDLYDFNEIKKLEVLMKKVKRVKVKKKIQSRIDKLMVRGL